MINDLKNKLIKLLSDYKSAQKEIDIRSNEVQKVLDMILEQEKINDEWKNTFNEKSSKEGLDIQSIWFSKCDTLTKTANRYTELTEKYGGDMERYDEITEEYLLNKKYLTLKYSGK